MRNSIFEKMGAYVLTAALVGSFLPMFPASNIASNSTVAKAVETQNTSTSSSDQQVGQTSVNQANENAGDYDYEKASNLSNEQYTSLGFDMDKLKEPAEFSSTDASNPLENLEPTILSELYVGTVNRDETDDDFQGHFFITNNAKGHGSGNLSVNKLDDNLIGNRAAYTDMSGKTQCVNVVALNSAKQETNADKCAKQVIVQTRLYELSGKSYQDFAVLSMNEKNEYVKGSVYTIKLKDDNYITGITANAQFAYMPMSVGDYDRDGYQEVAVYISDPSDRRVEILDLKDCGNGKYNLEKNIEPIHIHDVRPELKSYGGKDVFADLDTTSMAGYDDLVVNISYNYDQGYIPPRAGLFAVYHVDDNAKIDSAFSSDLLYPQSDMFQMYTMKQAATNADVNGDGTDEVVVSGVVPYYNKTYLSHKTGFNVLYYQNGKYTFAKKNSMFLMSDLDYPAGFDTSDEGCNFSMTAGKYVSGQKTDTILVCGSLYNFVSGKIDPNNEDIYQGVKSGKFNKVKDVAFHGDHNKVFGYAVTGHFDETDLASEQTVYCCYNKPKFDTTDHVDINIGWVTQNSKGELDSFISDSEYFHRANEDDNGTCLVLAPINVDSDSVYMTYKGKHVGWSDPNIMGVMLAPPYWGELDYGDISTSRGNTAFSISESNGDSSSNAVKDTLRLSGGMSGGVDLFGLASVNLKLALDVAFDNTNTFTSTHTTGTTMTFKQGNGTNSVALMLTPLVTYQYDTFVPEHIADAEEAKLSDDINVGDKIPAKTGVLNNVVALDPAFSTIPVETYNSIAKQYNAGLTGKNQHKLSVVDLDKIYQPGFDSSDPSTFVSDFSELGDAGEEENRLSSQDVAVTTISGGTQDASLTESDTDSTNYSFSIVGSVSASVETKASFFASGGSSYGGAIGLGYTHAFGSQTTNGQSYTGSFVGLPTAKMLETDPSAYAYNVKVAKWEPNCLKMKDSDQSVPVVGYLVSGVNAAPPKAPADFKVTSSTTNKQVLTWTKPVPTAKRLDATEYKIFSSTDGTTFTEIPGLDIGANDTKVVITGLQENTTYYYRMQAITKQGGSEVKSALGNKISGKTKSPSTTLIQTPPRDCYASVGDVPEISLVAKDVDEGDTLSYQWQKLSKVNTGYNWADINNDAAKSASFNPAYADADGKITSANKDSLNHTVYRCKVIKTTAQRVTSVDYSRAATLYIGEAESLRKEISVDMELNTSDGLLGAELGESNLEAQILAGEELDINVEVLDGASPVAGHKVFVGLQDENKAHTQKEYTTDSEGQVTVSLDDLLELLGEEDTAGTFKVVAYCDITDDYRFGCSKIGTVEVLNEYHIAYQPGAGTISGESEFDVTKNDGVIALEEATREGYEFLGWYSDAACTKLVASSDDLSLDCETVTDDMTLYAKWSAPIAYAIDYHLPEGVENANPETYTIENSIVLGSVQRNGYIFDGWYEDSAYTKPIKRIEAGNTGKLDLYPKWTEAVYNIVYILNGGMNSEENPEEYKITDADIALQEPTRTYCEFVGWYLDEECKNPCTKIETGSYGDLILYAKWTGIDYTVKYECNGGANSNKNKETYNTADGSVFLYAPSRAHYTFEGWYSDAECNNREFALRPAILDPKADSVTLYAKWAPIKYEIRYNYCYGEPSNYMTKDYTAEDGKVAVITATRQGYTFDGWYQEQSYKNKVATIDSTMFEKTDTLELYAKWKPGCEKHTMETKTKPATLSANGSIQKVCKYCDYKEVATVIAKPTTFTLSKTVYTYNEKEHKPTVIIKDSNGKEIAASNYTLKYSGNGLKVKKYTVTVTFKGNYSGTKELKFKTVPKSTSIKKVKAGKKKLTVTWKKQSKHIDGYQIRYRVKGTDKWKYKTITNKKATKCTIKKLKSGKKYELSIKTYKTSLDEKLGTWSKTVVKKVK